MEEMADRRRLQKKRPKMEKRKQRDERKEAGRRQKGRYKRKSKERASSNIQTQNRVCEGYLRLQDGKSWKSSLPLLQHLSVDHILWECKETADQTTNMDMKKEQ
jgi:hypothetical protein